MDMAVEIPATHVDIAADSPDIASASQPWPKASTAWFAAWVFAVALMFARLDGSIIGLIVGPIEATFHINDSQLSLLTGLAPILFYAFIAVPASRYVDIWPRNVLMTIGIAVGGLMTALCGLAQNFTQLFIARMGLGLGGLVNGPATYSMMADYFPREKLPRAIAVLQIGFICGGGIALIAGGAVVQLVSQLPDFTIPFIGTIHDWQLVFIFVGLPGLLVAALMRSVPEPARRGRMRKDIAKAIPLKTVVKYLFEHRLLYGPQFLAMGLSVVESLGTAAWQPVFFQRTYHWSAAQAGYFLGLGQLIAGPIGLIIGTWLTEHFVRKGDNAANLRVVAIGYTLSPLFTISTPLMPSPWFAVISASIAGMIGIGGAVPQNAAIQSITPNEMRGQVTALYLFIFAVLGSGCGPTFIALITNYVIGDQNLIRYALAGSAAIMAPLACFVMWQGVKPYGEAIRQLKEREAKGLV
jgi:MFS family permease